MTAIHPKVHPATKRKSNRNQAPVYDIYTLILLFFLLCLIGWLWELAFFRVTKGIYVNRGVLSGPWLPIYGTGGICILLLLRRFYHRPVLTFFLSMLLCSTLEYLTSWWLEYTWGNRWWDYSNYAFNLNGRICLIGAIFFGFAGIVLIYILAPAVSKLFHLLPQKLLIFLCGLFLILFLWDCITSMSHPNTGTGITFCYRIDYNILI